MVLTVGFKTHKSLSGIETVHHDRVSHADHPYVLKLINPYQGLKLLPRFQPTKYRVF
ncbi:hypothetical protein B6N60_04782 [Richelia sinica FACHB-800]|uniref:Uncharacterized protein n=1 Tax=Richelia sinica FACHB-800 TaxID=1357546 RepID=A0A975Y785_9NOST|nr:hypothetical protein B6N60_04782 [Richelia sinica FACHB-800]